MRKKQSPAVAYNSISDSYLVVWEYEWKGTVLITPAQTYHQEHSAIMIECSIFLKVTTLIGTCWPGSCMAMVP